MLKYLNWHISLLLIFSLLLSSCATKSNMLLFQDATPEAFDEVPVDEEDYRKMISIRSYDILQIDVKASDPEINKMFRDGDQSQIRDQGTGELGGFYYRGYMVDQDGNINLPIIGRVNVKGLSIREAQELIAQHLREYSPRTHVEVKFLTFKVYVFGEVNRPGLITVPNEQSNLLEALSLSGDITDFADRKNIKVLRGDPKNPNVFEIDLTKVKSFVSPGFELQPYDIIYVAPANRRFMSMISSDIGIILTFANSLFVMVNLYYLLN